LAFSTNAVSFSLLHLIGPALLGLGSLWEFIAGFGEFEAALLSGSLVFIIIPVWLCFWNFIKSASFISKLPSIKRTGFIGLQAVLANLYASISDRKIKDFNLQNFS